MGRWSTSKPASLRQRMAWLHTWSGLLVGWVLYFIFVTGSAGYFRVEIDRWMRPELLVAERTVVDKAIQHAVSYLDVHAPTANSWSIYPGQTRNHPSLEVVWRLPRNTAGSPAFVQRFLSEQNGAVEPIAIRQTGGGQKLYEMHYQLYYFPRIWGIWIVGFSAMCMLVALITGVITHKRFFSDFFTFRGRKGLRSWMDAHTLLGVLILPFLFMITYSGLTLLMFDYLPKAVKSAYGQEAAFFTKTFPRDIGRRTGEPAMLAPLGEVAIDAQRRLKRPLDSITIFNPRDRGAVILARAQEGSEVFGGQVLKYDGTTGVYLSTIEPQGKGRTTFDVMQALHVGSFSPLVVRWLYFFSGLIGCCVVATGLVLWSEKRRQRESARNVGQEASAHFGRRLVDRLNIATILGLPFSIGAYFGANLLLPEIMPNRGEGEVRTMFLAWAFAFVMAALRPVKRGWIEGAFSTSGVFFAVAVLGYVRTSHFGAGWPDASMVFNIVMLALAVAFGILGSCLRRL